MYLYLHLGFYEVYIGFYFILQLKLFVILNNSILIKLVIAKEDIFANLSCGEFLKINIFKTNCLIEKESNFVFLF